MQHHGGKYFACTPTDPGGGVKKSTSTFSEHVHVAYQIKVIILGGDLLYAGAKFQSEMISLKTF